METRAGDAEVATVVTMTRCVAVLRQRGDQCAAVLPLVLVLHAALCVAGPARQVCRRPRAIHAVRQGQEPRRPRQRSRFRPRAPRLHHRESCAKRHAQTCAKLGCATQA
eukprot:3633768-Rhodomonas_salina.1